MNDLEALASSLMEMTDPCVVLMDANGNGVAVALDGRHPLDVLAAVSPETAEGLDAVGMLVHGTAVSETAEGDVEAVGRVVAAYIVTRDDSASIILTPDGVQTGSKAEGAIPDAVRAFLG